MITALPPLGAPQLAGLREAGRAWLPYQGESTDRRERCVRCGQRSCVGFAVPDELWARVARDRWSVLCLACFDAECAEAWEGSIELFPVSRVTGSDVVAPSLLVDATGDCGHPYINEATGRCAWDGKDCVDGRRVVELPATCPTCEGGKLNWALTGTPFKCPDCSSGLVSVCATVHEVLPIYRSRDADSRWPNRGPGESWIVVGPSGNDTRFGRHAADRVRVLRLDDKGFLHAEDVTLLPPDGVEPDGVIGWWAALIEEVQS